MSLNKQIIILFSFILIVISIPFLEFIIYNFNITNERTDFRINYLTLKRLSSLYFLFIILFLVLLFIIKTKIKNNTFDIIIYLSSLYWVFFKYNDLKKIFHIELINFLNKYDGILSILLTIIIITLFTKFYVKKKTNFINILITIFFLINFSYSSSLIFFKKNFAIKPNQDNFKFEKINIKNTTRNNIYLFIIDAMPPIEIADKLLKTDSSDFLNKINSKGFTYIKNSKSLYGNTFLTLGSIFNLKPLEKIDNSLGDTFDNIKYPNLTFPTLLRKKNMSNLEYNLIELGYDIKWIGSHFANCFGYNRAYCIDEIKNSNILINYENLSFLKKTSFQPIMHYMLKILNIDIEEKIIFKSNNAMGNFNEFLKQNGKPKKPTFILIHHLISHWPYLVDSECNFEKNAGILNKQGIKKAFECNKKLISNTVEIITNIDEDAIVLVQSDHSWELSNYDPIVYGNRREIFNLIKTNAPCKKYENFAIQNINSIKLALYCATNTEPKF